MLIKQRTIGPVNTHLISGSRFHLNLSTRTFSEITLIFHSFLSSINCLHQLSGHRLQWFLKNPLFSIFPIEKPVTKFDLAKNRSRSLQGHHLNKLWWAGVPDATYQVLWKSVHWFQRRRFLKDFTMYGHGGHLGHVTSIMFIDFHFLVLESLHTEFG